MVSAAFAVACGDDSGEGTVTSGAGGAGSGAGVTSSASSSSSGGVGGSPHLVRACDELTCGDLGSGCVGCAVEDLCEAEYTLCAESDACLAYATCASSCGDEQGCDQDCATAYPDGASHYEALALCVFCDVCTTACADLSKALCP